MKTSASRWSKAWLPSVTASAPASRIVVADRLGDAEAAGRVLAVDHDAIEPPALAQARQFGRDRGAARTPDDVAEEEQPHRSGLRAAIKPRSVITSVEGAVVRLGRHALHLLDGEGDADGEDGLAARSRAIARRNSRGRSRCAGRSGRRRRAARTARRVRPRGAPRRLAEAEPPGDSASPRRARRGSSAARRARVTGSAVAKPAPASAASGACRARSRIGRKAATIGAGAGESRRAAARPWTVRAAARARPRLRAHSGPARQRGCADLVLGGCGTHALAAVTPGRQGKQCGAAVAVGYRSRE